ncbi:MAG: UDP-3-O-acyl-N-acetylglucosamine deacetylase [bacterium]
MLTRIAARPQLTLSAPVTISGPGVFTGRLVTVTVAPAPLDHGLVFLADGIRIPVAVASLESNPNRSALRDPAHPSSSVQMVEHVLSALHGLGIDNALITVEGGECPLGDGSSLAYVEAILRDGTRTLSAESTVLLVTGQMHFEDGAASLTVGPPTGEGLHIDYRLDYAHPVIGQADVAYDVTPTTYSELIAPARTFVPVEEAERLVAAGIVRSTDDSTCLVVYPDRTNRPLRVPSEFAAHKVLDLIGDLRLCGYPVWATVQGNRSGHGLNQRLATWLAETQV